MLSEHNTLHPPQFLRYYTVNNTYDIITGTYSRNAYESEMHDVLYTYEPDVVGNAVTAPPPPPHPPQTTQIRPKSGDSSPPQNPCTALVIFLPLRACRLCVLYFHA